MLFSFISMNWRGRPLRSSPHGFQVVQLSRARLDLVDAAPDLVGPGIGDVPVVGLEASQQLTRDPGGVFDRQGQSVFEYPGRSTVINPA